MFGNICVKCGRTVALTNKMSLLPLGKKLTTGTSVFGRKWFG